MRLGRMSSTWPMLAAVAIAAAVLAATLLRRARLPAAGRGPTDFVLDADRLVELAEGLPADELVALVGFCLADLRRRLPQLRATLAAGNGALAEQEAHALVGLAVTYGLASVASQMRRITALARSGQFVTASRVAATVHRGLPFVASALQLTLSDIARR